jgi:hypothetical protein
MLAKIASRIKVAKTSRLHILDSHSGGVPKRFEPSLILLLTVFDHAHTFPQNFACILIASRGDESVNDLGLMVR